MPLERFNNFHVITHRIYKKEFYFDQQVIMRNIVNGRESTAVAGCVFECL